MFPLFATPWTATCQASLSATISQSLLKTHVCWVGEAIQLSHPLSPTSPPAFNFSQHQGPFQWVSFSHQVIKVLELQLQHQSFQWMNIQGWFPLGLTGLISLLSNDCQESAPAAIQVDWAFGNLGYFIMLPGQEVQRGSGLCLMESQHPCCHL